MSKYIIDTDQFEKLFETKAVAVLGIGDNLAVPEEGEKTVWTRMLNVADLEELTSDYINEHFGDLQDTAYQKGFEDGKAVNDKGCEGCKWAGMTGQPPCIQCSNNYPNVWQKQDDKIEVGDEVEYKGYKDRFVVTKMQNGYVYGISKDGSWNNFRNDGSIVKTGRHFDIDKILDEMKGTGTDDDTH